MNKKENRYIFIFISLLIVGIIFPYTRWIASNLSLSPDEIYTWRISSLSLSEFFSSLALDTQMPLYFIITSFLETIFGALFNDYWIRVPSIVFFMTSFILLFRYGIKTGLSPLYSFLVLIPFLQHSNLISFSTYARPYGLFFLLSTVNLFSLLSLVEESKDRRFDRIKGIIFNISLTGMAFTHHLFIFYILPTLISVFLIKDYWKVVKLHILNRKWLVFHLLTLGCLYIPFFILQFNRSRGKISWIEHNGLWDNLNILSNALFPGELFSSVFLGIVFAVGIVVVFYFTKLKNQKVRFFFYYLISCSFLLLLVTMLIQPLFETRYLVALFFPILIFTTFNIFKILKETPHLKFKMACLISLAPFLVLLSPHSLIHTPHNQKRYIKEFVRELNFENLKKKTSCLASFDFEYSSSVKGTIFSPYSKMYFGHDLCEKYLIGKPDAQFFTNNQSFILFYDGIRHPNDNLKIILSNGYKILKSHKSVEEQLYLLEKNK